MTRQEVFKQWSKYFCNQDGIERFVRTKKGYIYKATGTWKVNSPALVCIDENDEIVAESKDIFRLIKVGEDSIVFKSNQIHIPTNYGRVVRIDFKKKVVYLDWFCRKEDQEYRQIPFKNVTEILIMNENLQLMVRTAQLKGKGWVCK